MKDFPLKRTGSALMWKAVQLGGVKAIFFFRLLILARLLIPEAFGLLAIAATAIGFLMQLTDLGMVPALVQGKAVSERQYNTAWTIGVTRALFVSISVIVVAPFIAQLFSEPRSAPIIQVLAFRPLLDALSSIKVAELTRRLQFRPLATLKLVEAIVNTTVSIALAPSLGVWALVVGTLTGSVTYLVVSYVMAPHWPRFLFNLGAARPLIRFGRWAFLTGLVVMAGGYILQIVISRQLGAVELGIYYLAASVAFLPTEVASGVVGEVAFPLFARLQTDLQRITRAFRTFFIGISALLFPVCALIFVLAPALVHDVLGPEWARTLPVIRVLALVSILDLLGDVMGPIFQGLGQPYKVTVIEMVQSLLLIILAWVLTNRFGLIGAAFAWLPAIMVARVISIIFLQRLLPLPFRGLASPITAITVVTAVGAITAGVISHAVPGLIGFNLAILVAIVITGGLLWVSDRSFRLGLMDDLGHTFPKVASLLGYSPADV